MLEVYRKFQHEAEGEGLLIQIEHPKGEPALAAIKLFPFADFKIGNQFTDLTTPTVIPILTKYLDYYNANEEN